MGNINNYVTVTITKNSIGITRAGFGTLLVLSQNAPFVGRTKTYSDYAAVAVDYPLSTAPENIAAAAVFGQSLSPKQMKIGRRANKSTMVYSLSVVTVRNSYTYELYVSGQGFARTLVSFTSDASATDGEIIVGLVAALNAVVSKNYTAAGTISPATVTASAAGGFFCLQVVNPNDLKISMTHADPGVAADLTAIALADPDFYSVYNFSNSLAEGPAIATWVEANKRIFILDTNQTDSIITAESGATDVLKVAKTAAYTRTMGMYHHRLDQMPGAALNGRCLPITPGGETWADKTLSLVNATNLEDTHRNNLVARNANGYEGPVAGIGITFNGMVASGEFLDVTRFLDYFKDDAQKAIFGVKTANDKISYDDPGIRKIANEFRASLARGVEAKGFVDGSIKLTVPNSADVAAADRTARVLNGLKAEAQLAGAIHIVSVAINVVA